MGGGASARPVLEEQAVEALEEELRQKQLEAKRAVKALEVQMTKDRERYETEQATSLAQKAKEKEDALTEKQAQMAQWQAEMDRQVMQIQQENEEALAAQTARIEDRFSTLQEVHRLREVQAMEGEDRLMAMHRKVHATRAQQTEVEYIMELQGLDRIQGMCRVLDTEDAQVVGVALDSLRKIVKSARDRTQRVKFIQAVEANGRRKLNKLESHVDTHVRMKNARLGAVLITRQD